MEWRNIYRGFCMGVSDLIPGVSGGTIAVVLGIYEQLLAAISGFFSREWKTFRIFNSTCSWCGSGIFNVKSRY